MKYAIDRFEGEFAILEAETEWIQVLKNMLPEDSAEGDLLEWTETGWQLLSDETVSRKKALAERRRRMLGESL